MDKKLQKKLLTEIMHEDEDDGLYDTDNKVGKLYLQRLKHEYEELKKEVDELKKDIDTIHEYYKRRRS